MISNSFSHLPRPGGSNSPKKSNKVKLIFLKDDETYQCASPSRKKNRQLFTSSRSASEDGLVNQVSLKLNITAPSPSQWAQKTHRFVPSRASTNLSTISKINKSKSTNDLQPSLLGSGRASSFDQTEEGEEKEEESASEKCAHRSVSNRLLNCFTIDDCRSMHRDRLALGYVPFTPENAPSTPHDPPKRANSINDFRPVDQQNQISRKGSLCQSSSVDTGSSSNMSLNMHSAATCPEQRTTLEKAMHTLLKTKEVVNNTTREGLYSKGRHRPELKRNESSRFVRLNESLRRWIDEEYIRPRTWPASHTNPRNTPEKSIQRGNTKVSMKYRNPGTGFISVKKKRRENNYMLSDSKPDQSNSQDEDCLLEMLIDMDKKEPKLGNGSLESQSADSSSDVEHRNQSVDN